MKVFETIDLLTESANVVVNLLDMIRTQASTDGEFMPENTPINCDQSLALSAAMTIVRRLFGSLNDDVKERVSEYEHEQFDDFYKHLFSTDGGNLDFEACHTAAHEVHGIVYRLWKEARAYRS